MERNGKKKWEIKKKERRKRKKKEIKENKN